MNTSFLNNYAGCKRRCGRTRQFRFPDTSYLNVHYQNCSFDSNTVDFNGASGGGALSFVNSNPIISNCSFVANQGKNGGAIYNRTFNLARQFNHLIDSCTFSRNKGGENAGAIYCSHEPSSTMNLQVSHSVFDSNYATGTFSPNGRGGAVVITGNGAADYFFISSEFDQNSASREGGAMYITHSTSADTLFVTVEDCVFNNNDASSTSETIDQYAAAPGAVIETLWKNTFFYNDETSTIFSNGRNITGSRMRRSLIVLSTREWRRCKADRLSR